MIDAGIHSGDIVIVEKGRQAKTGDIVLAQVDQDWTLKYFRREKKGVVLVAANPKYPKIYPKEELIIGGVVKAVIRRYGDEIFGAVGLGYAISENILPVVEAEYSFVYPERRTIAGIHTKSKHVSSIYVRPSVIITLSHRLVIRSSGRILIRRDTVAGRDAGFLWGNLEDQSKHAAQIGLQIGLF